MRYESLLERFEATAPGGASIRAEFVRAGFLTVGDRPDLYFFRVTPVGPQPRDSAQSGPEDVAVGVSGDALKRFQNERRSLSREEKIDLAGLMLKRNIEAGRCLDSNNLFIRDLELASLAGELGILG
jgi:hypothetical protein